tara:strand:+ start:2851 stop:2997 length:147 start_codon:yes stop_codon:yes gene_type:complete
MWESATTLELVVVIVFSIALAATVISWLWHKVRGDSWPVEEGQSSWWL